MIQSPGAPILAPAAAPRATRRRLLARLAAVPAILALASIAADGEGKNKKKRKKGRKKNGNGGGGYSPDSEERKFLDLINDYRQRNGAGALSLNDALGSAADAHSRDMAKKNSFRHSKTGQLAERHGYKNWRAIGENIAAGQESAQQAFDAWRRSSGHDRNMRDKDFTDIGIGRAHSNNSKYGWYWTTVFGDR